MNQTQKSTKEFDSKIASKAVPPIVTAPLHGISRADLEARFPELDASLFDLHWADVEAELCLFVVNSCGCTDRVLMYAMAHLLLMFNNTSGGAVTTTTVSHGRAITSKSVDGVSVSYGAASGSNGASTPSMGDDFWNSTPYGKMYLTATNGCGHGAFFV